MPYIYSLISVMSVSAISFVGVFFLALRKDTTKKIVMFLVSLSSGSLLGGAILHLLPEAAEKIGGEGFIWTGLISGIVLFFILEKFICWRHCHIPTSHDHPHPLGKMNLIGDALHNFLDGIVIAAAYLSSPGVGIAATIAVIAHEIPQEIGDFGVLLHAGYTRRRALTLNFLIALSSVAGALITLMIGPYLEHVSDFILPVAAGGFLYIASADLIPELKKENSLGDSLKQLAGILIGIAIMFFL